MEEGLIHHKIVWTMGSMGLGLVWGWLMGSFKGREVRPLRAIPIIALTALLVSAQVLWLLDWIRVSFFFGAMLFAFVVHIEWRRQLIHIERS